MDLAINEDMRTIIGIVARIDGYTTWLSVIIGMAGWEYIGALPHLFLLHMVSSFAAASSCARRQQVHLAHR
jgi:hypothetical protein